MKAQQWGELKGKAITKFRAAMLTRIAREKFGPHWTAEFRYWLTCRGYYTIKNRESETPVYVGTTVVIPKNDFDSVKKELIDVACPRTPAGVLHG